MSQRLKPLYDGDLRIPDLFFDPSSKVIYLWKSVENKKIKFSTRVKVPDTAKAKRVAIRELMRRLTKRKVRSQSLIKDELELWLKVKESEGHKYDTMNNIRRAKRQIEEFWGSKFPNEINRDGITAWYSWWKETYPDIQMENAVKYLRNFCRYLAEKVIDGFPLLPAIPTIRDPGAKDARARRQKKKERIITAAELKMIRAAAPDRDAELAALIMYTMATRVAETLSMRFGEEVLMVDPLKYRWRVGQNKANLWGEHYFHPALVPLLKQLSSKRESEGTIFLFPQGRDNQKCLKEQQIDWQAWRDRANLGWHWTPHTFRHTCLSNLFNNPKNAPALICKLYRVSMPTAMEHYIKPTEEGTLSMREAIPVSL